MCLDPVVFCVIGAQQENIGGFERFLVIGHLDFKFLKKGLVNRHVNTGHCRLTWRDGQTLNKAFKKIADLLEDIERMSNELQKKYSLLITLRSRFPALTSWLETSQAGESALQHNTSGTQFSVSCPPRGPAWSTPNRGTPWTNVVVRGSMRALSGIHGGAPSTPSLQLSHKYAALSVGEKPAALVLHQETLPVPVATDTMPPLTDTTAFPPLTASCPPAG